MATKRCALDQDLDYEEVAIHQNKRQKTIEKDGLEVTKKKVQTIIRHQFEVEIANKEQEVLKIDDRLGHCKTALDRLRACIVAKYYGGAGQHGAVTVGKVSNQQPSIHPTVKKFLGKTTQSTGSFTTIRSTVTKKNEKEAEGNVESFSRPATPVDKNFSTDTKMKESKSDVENKAANTQASFDGKRSSRFKVKKRIIVGNVSKYIPVDKREDNDPATHKWMVYVRGPKEESNISSFVKKVWFFLHPSYRPNDLVELSQNPFQLTRRGWGEFPIRVQLHFRDTRNKRVDIIHLLKLDKTYTGLQTLGAETTVDIEIEREDVPVATITRPLPQATSTPLQTQVKSVPIKGQVNVSKKHDSSCVDGRKSLDSSGNSVDSDMQNGSISKRCESEISDTSVENDAFGGIFGSSKVTQNGLKRTSSLSSNMSSSSELLSIDRRASHEDWSTPCNSRVPSTTATSPSDHFVRSVSRGATPDFTSVKVKQEIDETSPHKIRKPNISLNLAETPILPPGVRIKTEPMDGDDVGSTVTTPDSGISIRPEPMDLVMDLLGTETGSKIKSESESLNTACVPNFESSKNETLNVLTPSVANSDTKSVQNTVSGSSKGMDAKGVTVGKTNMSPAVSPAQNIYIKCVDPQGNVCLIQQHLLMKTPVTTPIGKSASAIQTGIKPIVGQSMIRSPSGVLQTMLIPTPGANPGGQKLRTPAANIRPPESGVGIIRTPNIVGTTLAAPANIILRAAPPSATSANQKQVSKPTAAASTATTTTRLILDPATAAQVVGRTDQAAISARLKPPGAVSLLNRVPSSKTPVATTSTVTVGNNLARLQSPKPRNKEPTNPILTLKNLSPIPTSTKSVQDSLPVTGTLENQTVLTITSSSSPIPSATGPPPTAQLVKANIGGKLVWLQLFPNQKSGTNKAAKSLAGLSPLKSELQMPKVSATFAGKDTSSIKTNADGNITITMGTGNYQASVQKKLLGKTGHNLTFKNNNVFNQDGGISNMKTLPRDSWAKYRQKRVDDVKQAERPINPELYGDFASLLKAVVKQYPLLHPNPDRSIHPYCVSDLKLYRGWNIGKRRAAEWQRASDVHTRIQSLLENGSMFRGEKIWTTKRIMTWCRHHLFTPFEMSPMNNTETEGPLTPTATRVDSYTDVSRVVADLEPVEMPVEDDDSDVEIIDVLTADVPPIKIKKEYTSPIKDESRVKYYMPITPEADYVRDVSCKVGVQLKSVELEQDVFAPVVEDVIFAAMKEFTENILLNAARIKIQNNSPCDELTAIDLYQSISSIKECDFLTNNGLGREIEKKVLPSKPS